MGHSYVEFRSKGFFVNDVDLMFFARLVQHVAKLHPAPPPGVTRLIGWWDKSLDTAGNGCIDLCLDEYVDEDCVEYLCAVLADAEAWLCEVGPTISAGILNEILNMDLYPANAQRKAADFDRLANQVRNLLCCGPADI
jgi:hypothetical protein